jgi:AcrR family transcriptional regulator
MATVVTSAPPSEPTLDPSGRDRLLHAAIDLFDRKGYAATAVREIVAAAGLSKPALYYHFGSKEGIFRAIMRRAAERLAASREEALHAEGSARARIHALGQGLFALVRDEGAVLRLIQSGWNGPPQETPPFDTQRIHRSVYEAVAKLVAEGVRNGEFRAGRLEEMTLALLGATSVCIEMELAQAEPRPGPEGLAGVLDAVFDGLAHGPARDR